MGERARVFALATPSPALCKCLLKRGGLRKENFAEPA